MTATFFSAALFSSIVALSLGQFDQFKNCSAEKCISCSSKVNCTLTQLLHQTEYDLYNLSCRLPVSLPENCVEKVFDPTINGFQPSYCTLRLSDAVDVGPITQFTYFTNSDNFKSEGQTCEYVDDPNSPNTANIPLYPNCTTGLVYETDSIEDINDNNDIICACYQPDCQRRINVILNITNATYSGFGPLPSQSSSTMTSTTTTPTGSSTPSTPTPTLTESSTLTALLSVIGVLGFLFLITFMALIVIIACYCHKNSTKSRRHSHQIHFNATSSPLQESKEELPMTLMQTIGNGKFGSVWKALYNQETVAVKIFSLHHKSSWENEIHINALDSTPHENILPFIDSQSRGTGYHRQFFIITQYCPLGSLNQFLRHNVLSWEQALNMMYSVSRGLSHLHSTNYYKSNGLVLEKYAVAHRDIKTSNILLKDESGQCLIGDMGLALVLDPFSDDRQLANSGQVGTYRYMAPEALESRVNLRDIESFKQIDVYALAFVLWEVCTRCKLGEEPVQPYQPPLYDVVGERPSLDQMKEAVVIAKHRPTILGCWYSYKNMQSVINLMVESWDEDPEGRLTAANITDRLENINSPRTNTVPDQATNVRQSDNNCLSPESESSFCKKVHISASFCGSSSIPSTFTVPPRFSMDDVGSLPMQDLLSNDEGLVLDSLNDVRSESGIAETEIQLDIDKTTGQSKTANERSDNST